ncbi:cytochrome P450 [Lactarius deliciosus]|nr:cytochrome P450 [Lactarius deliciosus]
MGGDPSVGSSVHHHWDATQWRYLGHRSRINISGPTVPESLRRPVVVAGSRTYSSRSLLEEPLAPNPPGDFLLSEIPLNYETRSGCFRVIASKNTPILVLNSLKAASELLDRRADIYSGRPRLIMAQEIVSGGLMFAIINHTAGAVVGGQLTRSLQKRQFAVITIFYLKKVTENDKNLKEILAFADRMSEAVAPGAYLVELFPWMLHIPERFAKWKYEGNRDFTRFNNLFESLFDRVLSALSDGSERPKVQKRAHVELDTVVGRSRTPTFSDAPNLPYIQAIAKEVLRWRPALPFSLPHSTMEGLTGTMGCLSPREPFASRISCSVTVTHLLMVTMRRVSDQKGFLARMARSFRVPQRRTKKGTAHSGLGSGPCMGKHIVNESLFIYIATALWAVTFDRVRDEDGNEVPLDADVFVDTGMSLKPGPYECKITPRFGEVVSILAAEEELLNT